MATVLIANRGEIAVRIVRAARSLGMTSVAVVAEDDIDSLHARLADRAVTLSGTSLADTYLNQEQLIAIARRERADFLHPGYGFLSENADFARAVAEAGITWVGPAPEAIEQLGDKLSARALAMKVGAPLAPGTPDPITRWQEAAEFAREHGLPIAIKAAHGGGGRGLKVVWRAEDIEEAFASAGREAQEAFGRPECYVEKFLVRPRHVEAQVLADAHGNVRVLGTRDCSVQRRYQKLVEEAPAPFLSADQERAIVEGARRICQEAGYTSAGTVEFIVSADGTVSFLEVNTRVQVEHPVTEVVTGVDIVAEQFRIAAGEPLSLAEDPTPHGHALEFRINAEDVAHGFVPCPGKVTHFAAPTGPHVRTDSGVLSGSVVSGRYDSLLAKVIVWGPDRAAALGRARDALHELSVEGVRTVVPFHLDLLANPAFAGEDLAVYTNWVDTEYSPGPEVGGGDIERAYVRRERITIDIDGVVHSVGLPAEWARGWASAPAEATDPAGWQEPDGIIRAPANASIRHWAVEDGAKVSAGDTVAVLEAMKMEVPVTAPVAGVLTVHVAAGETVDSGQVIAEIR